MSAVMPEIRSRHDGLVFTVIASVSVAGVLLGLAVAGLIYQSRLSASDARSRELALALRQTQAKLLAQYDARARDVAAPVAPAAAAPKPDPAAASAASAASDTLRHHDLRLPVRPLVPLVRSSVVRHPIPDPVVNHDSVRDKLRDQDGKAARALQADPAREATQTAKTVTPEASQAGMAEKDEDSHKTDPALMRPLQAVSAQAAGLRSLDANGVVLVNGQSVSVGGYFPSGEQLLKVDPKNNEIITSRRTLVLFFGRSTHH